MVGDEDLVPPSNESRPFARPGYPDADVTSASATYSVPRDLCSGFENRRFAAESARLKKRRFATFKCEPEKQVIRYLKCELEILGEVPRVV